MSYVRNATQHLRSVVSDVISQGYCFLWRGVYDLERDASKNLSRQMIRMNHNAFFRNSGRKLARAFTAESFSRNIETVRLAFDKHSPPSNVVPRGSPIIFLHGLFGSKINNRTVSKYEGDK